MMASSTSGRPKSAVSQTNAFLSFLGFAVVLLGFRWLEGEDTVTCFLFLVIALALPHIWQATATEDPNPTPDPKSTQALDRNLRKLAGLAAIYGVIALAYFAFQGYYESQVKPLWEIFERVWMPLLVVSPIYVWLTDRSMDDPYDGLYQVGLAVTGSGEQVQWPQAQQYLLGWCVKAFFIPLMTGYALKDIQWFLSADILAELQKPGGYYFLANRFVFFIDVVFASVGYLCALRLIGSHIRSTEPTVLGWLVCIICYEPFWAPISRNFFAYEEGYYWDDWLAGYPIAWVFWSLSILLCLMVYVWTSITFGISFSNLTNRGILTNGPYRWLKHPHYVSKNISWWLISVPFLTTQSPEVAVRNCLLLFGVNVIYFLRAKTEERHLSRDPAYVEYSNWIKSNGLFAILRRSRAQLSQKN
jgi:protein-S-isoprenylcysteine O-methyltransferase Ste14